MADGRHHPHAHFSPRFEHWLREEVAAALDAAHDNAVAIVFVVLTIILAVVYMRRRVA
jgi:hypothetical protein